MQCSFGFVCKHCNSIDVSVVCSICLVSDSTSEVSRMFEGTN